MFERFTDRARRVVVLAQEEARLLNHSYIGTEHLLLGLVHEGEGIAAQALEQLGISLQAVRREVEEIIGEGQGPPTGHIPFTPRAKKVMELSLREALQLGHSYIGTEHIVLGLIREGEGVAAQVLHKLGADLAGVRRSVMGLLAGHVGAVEPVPGEAGLPTGNPRCPRCSADLVETARHRPLDVAGEGSGEVRRAVVVFCVGCGAALGVLPPEGGMGYGARPRRRLRG